VTPRICPACGRAWVPVQGEPPWPRCPTCRHGMAPLCGNVGGRTREEAERAPREPAPPKELGV